MIRCWIIVGILLIVVKTASAQERSLHIEISPGISFSRIMTTGDFTIEDIRHHAAVNGNLSLQWYIKRDFYVKTQAGFLQNGFRHYSKDYLTGIDFQSTESYFQIDDITTYRNIHNDWLFGYSFGKRLKYKVSVGMYYTYYLNSKRSYTNTLYIAPSDVEDIGDPAFTAGYFENSDTNSSRNADLFPWDYGVIGQCGIGYEIKAHLMINMLIDYYYGIQKRTNAYSSELFLLEQCTRSVVLKVAIQIEI